jgi:outer membrane protein
MKRSAVFLSFFILLHSFLRAQDKWDLKKCVDYALANNISVKQQDIQAKLAGLTYDQSRLSRYPNLNFTTNLGLNTGRNIDRTTNQFTTSTTFYNTFGLQTNVDVFNFFSKQNTIAANRFELEASKASVEKLKNDISLNVAGAYLQVLLNREQVNISRVQLNQTAAQLNNTRKLVQAGSVPELNAIQLEAQLAADSANVVTAKGAEAQSMLYLKALLNIDAGLPFDVTTPPIELIPLEPIADLQPEAVYQLALQNLPQQRMNQLRLRAAQRNADAAKGALYPSVAAGGSIQTNYSNAKNNFNILGYNVAGTQTVGVVKGTSDSVVAPILEPFFRTYANPYGNQFINNLGNGVGLSINVPIFNNGIARTNLQRAKLNVKNYELQQQQDNLNLKQDIYKAYTDAITSIEKFNAASKAVEAAQKATDFATKRYDIGLLNTLDLITTQSNLFRARLQRTLAQFDYVFKMKVLEFYKGQGLKL